MPAKRNYRKKKTKKRTRQFKKEYILVNKGPSFLPDKYVTTLKYSDRIPLTSISGLVNSQIFRGNSIYDPDYTSILNLSCRGFAELKELYSIYKVISSRINIKYISNVQTSGAVMEIGLTPTVSATDVTTLDPELFTEIPYGKFMLGAGDASSSKFQLTHYMTSSQMLSHQYANNAFSASSFMESNPTLQWFWHVNTQTVDESTTQSGYLYVNIKYYVELSSRKTV